MALDPTLAIRLIYIFGITNIISILLVLTSCRCMGIANITNRFFDYLWYKKYYSKHCWYWWIFIISVLLHTSLAFYIFGVPV